MSKELERPRSISTIGPTILFRRIELPSLGYRTFASSLRALAESPRDPPDEERSTPARPAVVESAQMLEPHLIKLDPAFAVSHRGARDALVSGNPERLRHAALSLRELILVVIDRLLLRVLASSDPEPDTRKARLRLILGGSKHRATYADSMATAVVELLNELSTIVHWNTRTEESAIATIGTAEYLLMYLITNNEAVDSEEPDR